MNQPRAKWWWIPWLLVLAGICSFGAALLEEPGERFGWVSGGATFVILALLFFTSIATATDPIFSRLAPAPVPS